MMLIKGHVSDSMKLKILPPTLREKKRYIAFYVYSEHDITKNDFTYHMWNKLIGLYGEVTSSDVNLWLVSYKRVSNQDRITYKGILKCQRGYEKETLTMLASLTNIKENKLVVQSCGTSGTIKSLNRKYDLL